MRRLVLLIFISSTVLLLLSGTLWAQGEYYVQSLQAKVMSKPAFKSTVIGEASRGTKFLSLGREGNWIKVSFYAKEGYLPAILLSTHPPMRRVGLIVGEEGAIKQSVRRRASTYTSAAAARGLAADDRRRLSKDEKVDYGSLEKIEKFKLSADDISRFMEGDKL